MSYEAERAIAKAATPGPREVVYDPDDDHDSGRRCPSWWVKFKDAPPQMLYRDSTLMREADAIHFATFNPEFCLGLLDKLERYEAALKTWKCFYCHGRGIEPCMCDGQSCRGGCDAGGKCSYCVGTGLSKEATVALNPTEANDG